MALTKAQLMNVPGGPGVVGAIKAGSGISISPDGTISVSGAGSVTSVDVSGGTTGLTFTGGPITKSGTITLNGILGVANGGTGSNTQAGAAAAILPTQSGQGGKFLQSNGTSTSWAIAGVTVGSAPPAGVPSGSLYWDNNLGEMFIYYNDGGGSQWVQTNFGRAV